MSSWNINNIEGHLPTEVWELFVNHNVAAGMLVGVLFLSLGYYPMAHKMYMAKSEKYREQLTRDQQLVVIQHTIEAVFLSLLFLPFTYVILSANFEEQDFESFKAKLTAITTFMATIILMYLIELASRFANLRGLIAAHHLCAYFDGALTAFFLSTANVKAASLLVYFITYEALTFFGLIMYRLAPTHKLTQPTILAGMIVFGTSRPIQFVWIIGSLVVTWKDVVIWQAVLQAIFTVLFTTLQIYSLTIHYKLYKRCGEMQKDSRNQYGKGSEVLRFDEESIVDVFELSEAFKSNHNDINEKEDIEAAGQQYDGDAVDELGETMKTNHTDEAEC